MPRRSREEVEVEKRLNLRITLEGEMFDRFRALQRRYGILSGVDMVRFLITQEYERLRREGYFE